MFRIAHKFSRGRLAAGVLAASLVASAALVGAPAQAAPVEGVTVAGSVLIASGKVPAGTEVQLVRLGHGAISQPTSGEFLFSGVVPGDYRLELLGEYVKGSEFLEVTDHDLDVELAGIYGGAVIGNLAAAGASERTSIAVHAYDEDGQVVTTSFMPEGGSGSYRLGVLPAGVYKIGFRDNSTRSSSAPLDDIYFDQKSTYDEARFVTVKEGETTRGVDAAWNADGTIAGAPPVNDQWGLVEGTVTTDLPTDGLEIIVAFESTTAGDVEEVSTSFADGEDWSGTYTAALSPGTYRVGFSKSSSSTSSVEVTPTYYGGSTYETAKTITVKADETVTGIDAKITGSSVPVNPGNPTNPTNPTNPGNPTTPGTPATPGAGEGLPTTGPAAPSGSVTAGVSSSGTVTPGESVSVAATGLPASASVDVYLHSTPLFLGTLKTNASGGISGTVALPATAPAGAHHIVLHYTVDGVATELAIAAVTITPEASAAAIAKAKAAGKLPSTGADLMTSLLLMTLLIAAGVSATLVSRRRRVTASV
ncbi:LPXTG-motif cell wall-anchored protein [Okibacterium sp. HSC-33S16]|uniref:LPXTG cell wall anchor domain-containing protein n=1 Tax=Okibacterium sp. HSC-33S16 TaxID=2910965 RepID=UPI00209E5270|nr:LPXTG cell wall anchor domain-containing protein [Okibacterium sp. HSC-33S16]MCP2032105.1 LPXTG-motif cell wall-anchored protein [Okibacterium sp. HSC-33S16]